MAEIDPVILRLQTEDAEYKASMKDVIRLNDQVSGAILVAANKIDAAADKMIAAFAQMAASDKASASAIVEAEAAKENAVQKAAAATAAAEKVQRDSEERLAKAVSEAAAKVEEAKEQVSKAATEAAAKEARAVQEAAVAEQRAANAKAKAARDAQREADRTAKAARDAAKVEERAQQQAARAAEKAAADKIRAQKATQDTMAKNAASIRATLLGTASAVGAGLGAREVASMADSYTRFTNQLRVAGLEGDKLTGTQDRLFQVAQRNGVELEAVGTLYSRAAQNQKELGASTSDLIDLTRSVSASLRISGTSTNEASGALLQLGQALGSPRVQAEEFNSLLDTMQPLLRQASKYIDGTGGSLAGLTQKLKDQKGPGVSNVELFRAIIRAMEDLEKQASATTLTISGAFTNLSNAITKFIGETDNANGATAAITGAINLLAENLDTVTEALAVLSAVMLGRFVAGMVGGAAATGVAATAIFALQARAAGAATTMEALALAGSAAGRSLLAAFGGPVGLAVTALTVGIGYLAVEDAKAARASAELSSSIDTRAAKFELARKNNDAATVATENLSDAQRTALTDTANLTGEAHKLADAWARVAAQAKAAAIEQARADYLKASGQVSQARNRLENLEGQNPYNILSGNNNLSPLQRARAILSGAFEPITGSGQKLKDDTQKARNELNQAVRSNDDAWQAFLKATTDSLSDFRQPGTPGAKAASGGKPSGSKSSGRSVDPAEVARRFEDDLATGQLAIEHAQADALGTAEARRALEYSQIEYEKARNARQIAADKDTSGAQKEQLLQQNERIAAEKKAAVYADALREAQDRKAQAERNSAQYAEDALRADASLATTRQASLAANLRILDSLEAQEKLHLEAQIAAGEIADAEKARADLARTQEARRTTTQQDHESPLEQRRRQVRETAANMGDAVENIELNAVDQLTDGLADATTEFLHLGGVAGDVLNSIINDFIRLAAQQAIFGSLGGGSGGGGLLGGLGKLFGIAGARAAGGPVSGGQTYLVGENGPELFRASASGAIVPNHQLNATAAASMTGVRAAVSGATGTVAQALHFDLRGAVVTEDLLAQMNQMAQEAAIQGAQGGRALAARDLKAMSRPRM